MAMSASIEPEIHFVLPPQRGTLAQLQGNIDASDDNPSGSSTTADAGFDATLAVQHFVDDVDRVAQLHPARLPRLRKGGVIHKGGYISFATHASRSVTGLATMARKLQTVGLTFIDDDKLGLTRSDETGQKAR